MVSNKKLADALNEEEFELDEVVMQLADMLGAALHFAGVQEDKIPDGVDAYLKELDELFDDDEDNAQMGYEEVVKVINALKIKHKYLF